MRISLSEPISISYKTFGDHSFRVSGGAVTSAKRVDGRNGLGDIAIKPWSRRDLAVTIIGDRPSDQDGTVCTQVGKELDGKLTVVIEGTDG